MTSADPHAADSAAPEAHEAHAGEAHHGDVGTRLNVLRAGVLGANDGIISVAGLVVGVAGATTDRSTIAVAGIAGLVAGALSMAGGEYVSVSTQRDTEQALLAKERWELQHLAAHELEELAGIYEAKGLAPATARRVAEELTEHDALRAHAEAELGIDPDGLVSPWLAAASSLVAFTLGALLPLVAVLTPPPGGRVPATFVAVLAALTVTGVASARLGGAPRRPAVVRNVVVGAVAMAVTYAVGAAVGAGL